MSDYTVANRDNLTKIGKKYGLSPQEVFNANKSTLNNINSIIKPGQVLFIPSKIQGPTKAETNIENKVENPNPVNNNSFKSKSLWESIFGGGESNNIPQKPNGSQIKVMLDAGHGGKDPGAVVDGTSESAYNMAITNKVAKILNEKGINTVMTNRDENKYGRQAQRDATNPNLFVSIHANAGSQKAKGTDTFYNNDQSKSLASNIQHALSDATKIKREPAKNDYVVLRDDNKHDNKIIPSVLVETGFLSNPQERAEMLTEEGEQKRAQAIAKGIIESINVFAV